MTGLCLFAATFLSQEIVSMLRRISRIQDLNPEMEFASEDVTLRAFRNRWSEGVNELFHASVEPYTRTQLGGGGMISKQ